MNKYVVGIYKRSTRKYEKHEVEGETKEDAVINFRGYILSSPLFPFCEYDTNDIKCIKKLNKNK